MSGKLVGEVLAASSALKADGLSARGFYALIAIAEKCHPATRQGTVRWDHICDGLYGASLRTAKRAVVDLQSVGLLRVVKRGFNNQHGRVCAPVYEIAQLHEQDTQMSHLTVLLTEKRGGYVSRVRHQRSLSRPPLLFDAENTQTATLLNPAATA